MIDESVRDDVATAMRQINQAWLGSQLHDLAPRLHPEIVMVLPGFSGRIQGRDALLAGFTDFCQNAAVHEYCEHDRQVDVAGDTAVVSSRYEMVYERSGARYRASGRDLWVFQKQGTQWIAVWRTMLDLEETGV
jgi:ketosteroid isomerase-like protein